MDDCCVYTGFPSSLKINDATVADRLMLGLNGVDGLDGIPVRSQVDPKGQLDGGIVHTKRFGARPIIFRGWAVIESTPRKNSPAYRSALNVLENAWTSALEGALNTPFTLSWTPDGLAGHSISVSYGISGQEIAFSGNIFQRAFVFGLIAAAPTISGA